MNLFPLGRKKITALIVMIFVLIVTNSYSEQLAIQPQFDYAGNFYEGMALVLKNDRFGYIDRSGKLVIPFRFKGGASDFAEGLAVVQERIGGKLGYINKRGKYIIPPIFEEADTFAEGLALVKHYRSQAQGLIDKTGKFVFSNDQSLYCEEGFDTKFSSFSEGLAAVIIYRYKRGFFDRYGYVDKKGQSVIPPKFSHLPECHTCLGDCYGFPRSKDEDCLNNLEDLISFSEGMAAVRVKGKWGYINKSGKIVVLPQFGGPEEDVIEDGFPVSSFSEGMAAVRVKGKWGYINQKGKFVVKPKFSKVSSFSEGFAAVVKNGKCGYINQKGSIVIKIEYDDVGNFIDGLAPVKISEKWGFINKTGSIAIKPVYDDVGKFSEGLAPVQVGTKWGYIKK